MRKFPVNNFSTDATGRMVRDAARVPVPKRKPAPKDQKRTVCADYEVAWINAQAKYYIANQNLERAEREKLAIERKINENKGEIEKIEQIMRREKGESIIAKSKGAVLGGAIGAVVGSRGSLAGGMKMAQLGMGVGGAAGALLEEFSDDISSEHTSNFDLGLKLNDLLKKGDEMKRYLDPINHKISDDLLPDMKFKRQDMDKAKKSFVECKK